MGTGTHALRRALVAATAFAIVLTSCGGSSSDDPPAGDASGARAALERRIDAVQARSKAAPSDPAPLAELAKLRFQLATVQTGSAGAYTKQGKAELRRATQVWERYLKLDPSRWTRASRS